MKAIQTKPSYLCSFVYVYNGIKILLLNLVQKKVITWLLHRDHSIRSGTAIMLTTSKLHENLMGCLVHMLTGTVYILLEYSMYILCHGCLNRATHPVPMVSRLFATLPVRPWTFCHLDDSPPGWFATNTFRRLDQGCWPHPHGNPMQHKPIPRLSCSSLLWTGLIVMFCTSVILYCRARVVDMLSFLWSYVYYVCLRRMLKWCLRLLTGKCELQRITESRHTAAASRVFAVGQCFIFISYSIRTYLHLRYFTT